jgi:methionine synthase II (cobalamin-independent)
MTIVDTIADEHYGRREDLAFAFAAALNEEAHELQALGVDVIQFDEPSVNYAGQFLSLLQHQPRVPRPAATICQP